MGKGIIFVGRANLNRNKSQQSMYLGDKYQNKVSATEKRKEFYQALRVECLKFGNIGKRVKRIKSLKNKYETYACSEKNMDKVFKAYEACFSGCKTKKDIVLKKKELPTYFNNYEVDKRIQKRMLELESIHYSPLASTEATKANAKTKNDLKLKQDQKKIFFKLLHEYLENSLKENRVMTTRLYNLYRHHQRDDDYLEELKKLYTYKTSQNSNIKQICIMHGLELYKKDIKGLQVHWDG